MSDTARGERIMYLFKDAGAAVTEQTLASVTYEDTVVVVPSLRWVRAEDRPGRYAGWVACKSELKEFKKRYE